mmetsp:Transcript_22955/g.66262  ORF Transcript_22955/g.66262 Transcript_22955/m.66262 type:complete len:245 (-) Transcript_22955:552-1286(-)
MRAGADHQGAEADAGVTSAGVSSAGVSSASLFTSLLASRFTIASYLLCRQPPHDVGKDVRPLLRHQPPDEQQYDLVVVNPEPPPPLQAPVPRTEPVRVDPPSPDAQLGDAVHPFLVHQLLPHERSRDVQSLEEVVLMPEEGMDDGLQPAHARVVVHVIGNVGMEGPHEGEVAGPGVVDDVEAGAVRDGDVDDGGIKGVEVGPDGRREGEAEVVLRRRVVGVEEEGDGDRIVQEEDLAATVTIAD